MSQPVCVVGNMCSPSPATYAPVPLIQGSPNVFVTNLPVGRLGDSLGITCMTAPPYSCREDVVTSASETVFVNGLGMARLGDQVLDQVMIQAVDSVFAG